jgi:nitrile hydratase beta subunit
VNGIHDMGGMHGFGPVTVERDEPVFHAPWEGRVLGTVFQVVGRGWGNIDSFRHAIERLDPVTYLSVGYYGRWLRAVETLLVDAGVLRTGEVEARLAGSRDTSSAGTVTAPPPSAPNALFGVVRTVEAPPRFAVGQTIRARNLQPAGHTRLPAYVRAKRGTVDRVHPACVFPDTHAHGRGERPQYVYSVRFAGDELWGADAEPGASVNIDLFEEYLEPARGKHA